MCRSRYELSPLLAASPTSNNFRVDEFEWHNLFADQTATLHSNYWVARRGYSHPEFMAGSPPISKHSNFKSPALP